MIQLKEIIAFVKRCVGKVGRFFGRPAMIRVLVILVTSLLTWLLKILIIVLLSMAGLTLPVG